MPPDAHGFEPVEHGDAWEPPTYPKAREGSRLLFAGDLFDRKPQRHIVHKLIPENSLVTIYGKRAAFKTFAVTDLVMTIGAFTADEVEAGARMDWWKRPVRHGAVVYVVAEGADGWTARMSAWMKRHKRNGCSHSVAVLPEPANLQDEEAVQALIDDIKYAAEALGLPVVMVVFDTLFRCYGGRSLSGDGEAGEAIAAATRVQREIGATVLLVNHSNANGDSFGSKMLPNSVDVEILVERDGKAMSATLRAMKVKDDDEPEFQFYLEKVPVFHPVTGLPLMRELPDKTTEQITSLVVDSLIETSGDAPASTGATGLSDKTELTYQALMRAIAQGAIEGLTYSEWWKAAQELGIKSNNTFIKARKNLIDNGFVRQTGNRFVGDFTA
jgi:hypothetical protein